MLKREAHMPSLQQSRHNVHLQSVSKDGKATCLQIPGVFQLNNNNIIIHNAHSTISLTCLGLAAHCILPDQYHNANRDPGPSLRKEPLPTNQ